MDLIIFAIIFLVVLAFHFYEKKKLLEQISDLSNKVYFTRTEEFTQNKVVDKIKQQDNLPSEEEQGIPLENVDPKEIMEALHGK